MMRNHDPRQPVWPLAAMACWTSGVLLAAVAWRLSPAERAHAWPSPAPIGTALSDVLGPVTLMAATLLLLAGLVLIAVAWRRQQDPAWRRSCLILALWPSVPLAGAWLTLPVDGPPGWPLVLWLLACAGVALKLVAARPRPGFFTCGQRNLLSGRLWRHGHVAVLVLGCAAGLAWGGFTDLRAVLISLALYPLYALLQLLLVLCVTWPHLLRLAHGRQGPAAVTVAWFFALVHWPSLALMVLTATGMLVWAREFGRGRSLAQLALSMGLLATLAAQGLPDDWTDHMRVGPGFVRQRAAIALADRAHQVTSHLPPGRPRTTAFLAELYPGIAGRPAEPGELERWWTSLSACRRGVLAWQFFMSDEYRRRHGEAAGESLLPPGVLWTELPTGWRERIGAFARPDPDWPPSAWDEFLARLYREILHREAAPAELAAWSPALSQRQRQRLVEALLEMRRELAQSPLDTIDCSSLRLHH